MFPIEHWYDLMMILFVGFLVVYLTAIAVYFINKWIVNKNSRPVFLGWVATIFAIVLCFCLVKFTIKYLSEDRNVTNFTKNIYEKDSIGLFVSDSTFTGSTVSTGYNSNSEKEVKISDRSEWFTCSSN